MKRILNTVTLALVLVLAVPVGALAQDTEAPKVQRPTSFGAGEAAPPVDSNDPRALLKECDRQLDACKRDAIGVPYLAAAYMAIWAILLAYLLVVRRGQSRLEGDLAEMEARLRELEGEGSDN